MTEEEYYTQRRIIKGAFFENAKDILEGRLHHYEWHTQAEQETDKLYHLNWYMKDASKRLEELEKRKGV